MLLDRVQVRRVEDAGLGLQVGPDHAHPDCVETVFGQKRGVVVVEPAGQGVARRHLVHLVEPVQDDDLAVAVGQPAAGGPERQQRAVGVRGLGETCGSVP